MNDLPVQVGERYGVVVRDPEHADSSAGQILQGRGAKAARADNQRAGALQLVLPGSAHAAQHNLARVALDFFAG
jgi:hypothetical protein